MDEDTDLIVTVFDRECSKYIGISVKELRMLALKVCVFTSSFTFQGCYTEVGNCRKIREIHV